MIPANKLTYFGRYTIEKELGRGGMGVIYLAHDPFLDRQVAIKIASNLALRDQEHMEKFKKIFFNEARAAGKLTHPNIVAVYDAVVENDQYCLVMEYVNGGTLKPFCQIKHLLPFDQVLKVIFQCAKALDYAHQNGVIHRDIKPSNIMLTSKEQVKITDFGIAAIKGVTDNTLPKGMMGSVSYVSPEHLKGEAPIPPSDIFALGIIMYELLTGIHPFAAETDAAILFKIANEDPQPLSEKGRDIPQPLESITMRALEKDPAKRYQSGLQLAADLSASFDQLKFVEEEIDFGEKISALKSITFFIDFSATELAETVRLTHWRHFDALSTIFTEGEIEDSFYIVVKGRVMVEKSGKPIAVLESGDCFGEMAHLGHTRRTATIKAVTDTMLMRINSSSLEQMSFATQFRFYKIFSTTLMERLNRTSEVLKMMIE